MGLWRLALGLLFIRPRPVYAELARRYTTAVRERDEAREEIVQLRRLLYSLRDRTRELARDIDRHALERIHGDQS